MKIFGTVLCLAAILGGSVAVSANPCCKKHYAGAHYHNELNKSPTPRELTQVFDGWQTQVGDLQIVGPDRDAVIRAADCLDR